MLIILLNITSGNAIILRKDILSELSVIRKIMGVWQQFDILFDDLTIKKLLELFARFKS